MATTEVLNLLSQFYNFGSNHLQILPLYFVKGNTKSGYIVQMRNVSKFKAFFWSVTLFISVLLSCIELYSSLNNKQSKNIPKILYHGFLLVSKVSAYSVIYVFNNRRFEMLELWKYLCPKKLTVLQKQDAKTVSLRKSKTFYTLILVCTIPVFTFYFIFLPIFALVLPCLHDAQFPNYLVPFCNLLVTRLYLMTTQFLFLVPISAISTATIASCLVTLKEIALALNTLWYVYLFKIFT